MDRCLVPTVVPFLEHGILEHVAWLTTHSIAEPQFEVIVFCSTSSSSYAVRYLPPCLPCVLSSASLDELAHQLIADGWAEAHPLGKLVGVELLTHVGMIFMALAVSSA